eukprot:scaffold29596_cov32-Tisochrysis_lutea.AAC.4
MGYCPRWRPTGRRERRAARAPCTYRFNDSCQVQVPSALMLTVRVGPSSQARPHYATTRTNTQQTRVGETLQVGRKARIHHVTPLKTLMAQQEALAKVATLSVQFNDFHVDTREHDDFVVRTPRMHQGVTNILLPDRSGGVQSLCADDLAPELRNREKRSSESHPWGRFCRCSPDALRWHRAKPATTNACANLAEMKPGGWQQRGR